MIPALIVLAVWLGGLALFLAFFSGASKLKEGDGYGIYWQ
jgi:hypothetical protein